MAELRFTDPHDVGFAGSAPGRLAGDSGDSGGPEAWQSWAAADTGRELGVVEPGVLAALGVAAAGATVIGRRRRRTPRWPWSGLDESELRRRREEFGGARHRDGSRPGAGRAAAAAPTPGGRVLRPLPVLAVRSITGPVPVPIRCVMPARAVNASDRSIVT